MCECFKDDSSDDNNSKDDSDEEMKNMLCVMQMYEKYKKAVNISETIVTLVNWTRRRQQIYNSRLFSDPRNVVSVAFFQKHMCNQNNQINQISTQKPLSGQWMQALNGLFVIMFLLDTFIGE